MLAFTIPTSFPGMNEIIAAARGNRYHSAHQKKLWTNTAAQCIPRYNGEPLGKLTPPVMIAFDWYEKNERRDPDNIMAGQKFIIDALVNTRILSNDGRKQIVSISHRFHTDAANPRVHVEVVEVQQ